MNKKDMTKFSQCNGKHLTLEELFKCKSCSVLFNEKTPAKKLFTVEGARWFDRINGNTYHACRITRHEDGAILLVPFQYGYGDQYRQSALAVMANADWLGGYDLENAYRYERDNGDPIIWHVSDGLKREAVALGK